MKILNDGSDLHIFRNCGWWVGAKLECKSCGCVVMLEWKDKQSVKTLSINDREEQVSITCPHCCGTMYKLFSGNDYVKMVERAATSKVVPN